jgi:Ni/Co efflux regulator RcnB
MPRLILTLALVFGIALGTLAPPSGGTATAAPNQTVQSKVAKKKRHKKKHRKGAQKNNLKKKGKGQKRAAKARGL